MSLWMCPTCKVLTGPVRGLCPKGCGVLTQYATVEVRSAPVFQSPPLPEWAIESARRVKAFMKPVPLTDAERDPDPDYGL